MVGAEGRTTLVGREETHGRPYPTLLERLAFLVAIIGAVMVGQWMWIESDWSTLALWPTTVCVLPLATLIVAEMLAKIIQRIHISSE